MKPIILPKSKHMKVSKKLHERISKLETIILAQKVLRHNRSSCSFSSAEKAENPLKADTGGSIQKDKNEGREIEAKAEQDL